MELINNLPKIADDTVLSRMNWIANCIRADFFTDLGDYPRIAKNRIDLPDLSDGYPWSAVNMSNNLPVYW